MLVDRQSGDDGNETAHVRGWRYLSSGSKDLQRLRVLTLLGNESTDLRIRIDTLIIETFRST